MRAASPRGRRVVVTGIGLVSPLAIGTEETWQALLAGRSGAARTTLFDPSQHSAQFACEVKNFDPLLWVAKKDVKKMDRFIQFAIAAADFAIKDAQLQVAPRSAESVGVYIGSGIGGFATIEREHTELMNGGPRRVSPSSSRRRS
jgi:3-oxoacyl-[acyl-carrier-protein] synthase II